MEIARARKSKLTFKNHISTTKNLIPVTKKYFLHFHNHSLLPSLSLALVEFVCRRGADDDVVQPHVPVVLLRVDRRLLRLLFVKRKNVRVLRRSARNNTCSAYLSLPDRIG